MKFLQQDVCNCPILVWFLVWPFPWTTNSLKDGHFLCLCVPRILIMLQGTWWNHYKFLINEWGKEGGRKKSAVMILGRLLVMTSVPGAMETSFPCRKHRSLYLLTFPGCCRLRSRTIASVFLALGARASLLRNPAPTEASTGSSELCTLWASLVGQW